MLRQINVRGQGKHGARSPKKDTIFNEPAHSFKQLNTLKCHTTALCSMLAIYLQKQIIKNQQSRQQSASL